MIYEVIKTSIVAGALIILIFTLGSMISDWRQK